MKKTRRSKYIILQDKYEQKLQKFRDELEEEVRPIIKEMALSIGVDMMHTQHSLSVEHKDYNEHNPDSFTKNINKKFEPFQDFVYFLNDEMRIEILFQVEKGEFKLF